MHFRLHNQIKKGGSSLRKGEQLAEPVELLQAQYPLLGVLGEVGVLGAGPLQHFALPAQLLPHGLLLAPLLLTLRGRRRALKYRRRQGENGGEGLRTCGLRRRLPTFDDAPKSQAPRARVCNQNAAEGMERVPKAGSLKDTPGPSRFVGEGRQNAC